MEKSGISPGGIIKISYGEDVNGGPRQDFDFTPKGGQISLCIGPATLIRGNAKRPPLLVFEINEAIFDFAAKEGVGIESAPLANEKMLELMERIAQALERQRLG